MLDRALRLGGDDPGVDGVQVTEDIMLDRALRLTAEPAPALLPICYRGHHARQGICEGMKDEGGRMKMAQHINN